MNYNPIYDTIVGEKDDSSSNSGSGSGSGSVPPADSVPPTAVPVSAAPVSQLVNPIETPEDDEMNDEEDDEHDINLNIIHESGDRSKKPKRPVSASIPKGVRYLKKSDGEPFWRKDIQYDFLDALFKDDKRVFTNPFPYCSVSSFYDGPKYTFGELYIRTLAESPKCSKVLKERLLKDMDMGTSVAKVCLLVNTGRMNTTINFVPEMRSTLRTYHSIPSLQADPSTGSSRQLQDTPRLKSILKAVSDVKEDFKSIEELLLHPPAVKPNTNLVLLLFLLSNNVNGIKYHHLHSEECQHSANSFMEFFLETNIHPQNRAARFLWIMYTYLETSFAPSELAANPFNPHDIPAIEYMEQGQLDNFDKDTDYEIEYSERMFRTRLKYLADEEHNTQPKRGNKSKKDRLEDEDSGVEDDEKHTRTVIKRKAEEKVDKQRKKQQKTTISSPSVKATNGYFDFDQKSSVIPSATNYPTFPFPHMDKVTKLNRDTTQHSSIPDEFLSGANKKVLMAKFQQSMKNKKVNTEEVQTGIRAMEDWGNKFFQYKKSVGNGLVDMEWEDIRYDMIHGIEDYLYRSHSESQNNADKDKEQEPISYEPFYEYETDGQRTSYIYGLLHKYTKWVKLTQKPHKIIFDLDDETMDGI